MTTATITITPRDLRTLLARVIPLAGTDRFLPAYNSVIVDATPATLTATATDRYRVGVSRLPDHDGKPAHGFHGDGERLSFILSLADAKLLLKLYPVARRGGVDYALTLTLDDSTDGGTVLTVSQPEAETQITVRLFPVRSSSDILGMIQKLVTTALEAPATDDRVTYNGNLLAGFSHLGDRVTFKATGPMRPVLVTAPYFVGAIMPVRYDELVMPGEADWSELLK